jgi:nucleotide-binding universal stress UspA family protein
VVAYLHDQAIVHLDLKPENIICLAKNKIKLIDFGLASCSILPDLLALDLQNPQGTPWYIAPEQLLGERDDPRCDIYSMGMLFYEMLTGQLPWPRSSKVRIARRRLRHDPAPPRYFNADIPPQIQTIILRAIARHAVDRYGTVQELQRDLESWQQLSITAAGTRAKKPPWWKRLFPGKIVQLSSPKPKGAEAAGSRPQIVGALIDSGNSDHMLAELKKQALIRSADVTLVHVVEEESDSHVRRYGIAVEGEKLMARLERSVQLFRRCSIDPSIRLVRGEVVEILRKLCTELNAELLVLGCSRKKEGLLRSASVRRRLEKQSPCPLKVAEEQDFLPATDLAALQPDQLTARQVLLCDIFLVDLWCEHLHSHTDFIYQLLLKPEQTIDLSEKQCRLGQFLSSLEHSGNWQEVVSILAPVHLSFHQAAKQMAELQKYDHIRLQEIYVRESLPLSCTLKKELGRVSLLLRAHLHTLPPSVPFLEDETCPVSQPDWASYGPILGAFNLDQDLCALIQKHVMHAEPLKGNKGK